MSKKRKSKFKVSQKHPANSKKLPKLIKTSGSVKKRKKKILEGTLKPELPYRLPESVPAWEWELLDQLELQYYKVMNKFYNSIVPARFRVRENKKIVRETWSIGKADIFHMVSSEDGNYIGFLGGKNVMTPQGIHALVDMVEEAIEEQNEFVQNYFDTEIIPNMMNSRNRIKFYVLVEEEPSPEFFEKDEITVDFTDEKFLDSLEMPFGISERIEENIGSSPVTIKVINSKNHPKTFFYYLQLKRVMRKTEQFGVIGI